MRASHAATLMLTSGTGRHGFPGLDDPGLELSLPDRGLQIDGVVLRLPVVADIDAVAPAYADPELCEAADLPAFSREQLGVVLSQVNALVASGRLAPAVVVDNRTGEIYGGGTLHHLDAERSIIEIGYWLHPKAHSRGIATKTARALAEHAFALGVQRVVAHISVGNVGSERVVERAGFTREGISRSMPNPNGRRVDKIFYSILPGE